MLLLYTFFVSISGDICEQMGDAFVGSFSKLVKLRCDKSNYKEALEKEIKHFEKYGTNAGLGHGCDAESSNSPWGPDVSAVDSDLDNYFNCLHKAEMIKDRQHPPGEEEKTVFKNMINRIEQNVKALFNDSEEKDVQKHSPKHTQLNA